MSSVIKSTLNVQKSLLSTTNESCVDILLNPSHYWLFLKKQIRNVYIIVGKEEAFHTTCGDVHKYTVTMEVSAELSQIQLNWNYPIILMSHF